MRILLIAPRAADLLYSDAEVQALLRSGLDITPRLGNVRHEDVLADIDTDEYDAFWFCGHATSDGLVLSDGVLMASELTPMVRDRFSLVVLNTCDSVSTAQMLQNETEAEIVATIIEAPDRLAFQTGVLFARELAKSGDVANAYNAARPGDNRTYVYLAKVKKKWLTNETMDPPMAA